MDDRPLESAEAAIGRLDGALADLQATLLARMSRRPTGDVELAFRATPKPGTVFLHGQTLNRADYPDLWAWAQGAGAVVAGGYGAGNGSTTFTVPDFRGKALRGVGAAEALGALIGADSRALTEAQMPVHDHTTSSDSHSHGGSVGSAGSHDHSGYAHTNGSHFDHRPSSVGVAGGAGAVVATNEVVSRGAHDHDVTVGVGGSHTHSVTTSADAHTHTVNAAGSGAAVDLRQASLGLHVAVWT